MAESALDLLRSSDLDFVAGVVRQDQDCPGLEVLDWSVEPISHEAIIGTTGGLFRVSGTARDGQRVFPWTVVVKRIMNPKTWAQDPRFWAFWNREPLAFDSGLLAQLPPGVSAPRSYHVTVGAEDAWVWFSFIRESTGRQWSLEHFHRAARKLGRFQGAYLCGTPLPEHPWLCGNFFRSIWAEDDQWLPFMNPVSAQNAWQSPLVQSAFDGAARARVLRLLEERHTFFNANDRLPQVLCHNDVHRRNMMWTVSPRTGEEELILIDWAFAGPGGLGNDLGELVGTSAYFFDYDPGDVETLEPVVMAGYLDGLAEAGAEVDPRLARLGCLIGLSFWMGAQLPGWVAFMLPPDSGVNVSAMYGGHTAEEVLPAWAKLDAFILDRSDEARGLMNQLGL